MDLILRVLFSQWLVMGAGTDSGTIFSRNVTGATTPPESAATCTIYRFGVFELRDDTGELWKHGIRVKLQGKPLKILLTLLERQGNVITRDELCARLWPAGTFVDFESGLNTATNRLRAALGDTAESPRYVETLPRLGYRFICPVTKSSEPPAPPITRAMAIRETSAPEPRQAIVEVLAPAQSRAESTASGLWKKISKAAGSLLAISAVVSWLGYMHSDARIKPRQPVFHQLTFKPADIKVARFAPDAQHVVYTAFTEDGRQTYKLPVAHLSDATAGPLEIGGTYADAGNTHLFKIRRQDDGTTLEFPPGKAIFKSVGWIDCARVSSRGDEIAFLDHPIRDDDGGNVVVVNAAGKTQRLTGHWNSIEGLAWSVSGAEIWFTASKNGSARALYGVSESGVLRMLAQTPASLRLLDVSPRGQALLALDEMRVSLITAMQGDSTEVDSSKFDCSQVDAISADGSRILFTEGGDGGGPQYSAYVFDQPSRHTTLVQKGRALALSPDGNFVITIDPVDRSALTITSVANRTSRSISGSGFRYQWAKFIAHSDDLLVGGSNANGSLTIARQDMNGGLPVPVAAPYLDYVNVSPDGMKASGVTSSYQLVVFNTQSGAAEKLPVPVGTIPAGWSKDSGQLYASQIGKPNTQVWSINIQSRQTTLLKTFRPDDPATLDGFASIVMAPSTGAYAYSLRRTFSRLYVVDGLG